MAGGRGYAKVFRRIWNDEKFRTLDTHGKLVALYALSGPSNRIGLFHFSKALAAEQCGMSRDRLDTVWGTVCHTLSWGWDEASSTVLLRSWWKWNPPENGSAFKGYMSDVDDVSDTPLISEWGNNLKYVPDSMKDTVSHTVSRRVSHTVSPTVSPPEPYPEPEPEPEPKKEPDTSRASRANEIRLIADEHIDACVARFGLPRDQVVNLAEQIRAEAKRRKYVDLPRALANWCGNAKPWSGGRATNGKMTPSQIAEFARQQRETVT